MKTLKLSKDFKVKAKMEETRLRSVMRAAFEGKDVGYYEVRKFAEACVQMLELKHISYDAVGIIANEIETK